MGDWQDSLRSELKEELRQLNFDIRKNVVKVTGDSYVMDEGTDTELS